MSTDTEFLTIKEAADKYAKAEITIRRFVRNVVKENDEFQRSCIQPSPDEVEKLKKSSKPFSYKVSSELLDNHYVDKEEKTVSKSTKHKNLSTKSFSIISCSSSSSLRFKSPCIFI